MDEAKAAELTWLRSLAGELSTTTLTHLEETLPWFSAMPPAQRSALGVVAQAGITSFISWYEDPSSTPWIASDVFGSAPRMLLSATSLQETLQVIRVVVSVVEDRVTGRSEALKDATLLYSREVAFAAANVYARAAEARGLWDARLEALVVDSILTGERDDQLPSRIAALGWHAQGEAAVLIGTVNAAIDTERVRRTGRKIGVDVLMGVQGARLVLVLGRSDPATISTQMTQPLRFTEIAERLSFAFSDDPIVLGPSVDSLVESAMSARAALAAIGVAKAWRRAPRPTLADDLLPERALAGDVLARQTLVDSIYEPLKHSSSELLDTIWCYLDNGRSLEATARELFVHPNTVRYRLKKVSEIIGWDATGPREALIIQAALIVGTVTHPSSRS
jgi:sugar diacid utilization regulator